MTSKMIPVNMVLLCFVYAPFFKIAIFFVFKFQKPNCRNAFYSCLNVNATMRLEVSSMNFFRICVCNFWDRVCILVLLGFLVIFIVQIITHAEKCENFHRTGLVLGNSGSVDLRTVHTL